MTALAETIRRNADRLHSLHARIGETLRHRSRSPQDREAWSKACADFHANFNSLAYPGGDERWAALMQGDSSEVETAIVYLEVDPWHFRSGYQKEMIWDRLKKLSLKPQELRRLEDVAFGYLHPRAYRHFWYMARFVCLRAGEAFWSKVASLAKSPDRSSGAIKATWLLLARRNQPVRTWISIELYRARYEPGHVPCLDFASRE